MQHDDAYLLDIYNACVKIIQFTDGYSLESFERDTKTQSAVLHQLLVLGEAVKRLSEDFRDRHSLVNWSLIAGMRDRIIHGYDVVDLKVVWNTVEKDIPNLMQKIEPLLSEKE